PRGAGWAGRWGGGGGVGPAATGRGWAGPHWRPGRPAGRCRTRRSAGCRVTAPSGGAFLGVTAPRDEGPTAAVSWLPDRGFTLPSHHPPGAGARLGDSGLTECRSPVTVAGARRRRPPAPPP